MYHEHVRKVAKAKLVRDTISLPQIMIQESMTAPQKISGKLTPWLIPALAPG
jgi:hypothetical protein